MIHHPMLLMRDPPPEIDVTRPALPKRIRLADLTGGATSETVDNTAPLSQYITESLPTGCTRSHPHENMDAACERKTIGARARFLAYKSITESVAQAQESRPRSVPFQSSDDPAGNVCSRESSRVEGSAPEPDAADHDGWIEWKGGECPVPLCTRIEVKLRNGSHYTGPTRAGSWIWTHDRIAPIIAYRVIE